MSKRRQKHAEHENAERWLLTYADMITLLMAFFIMLYSMSQLDLKKFAAVAGSVRAELGGTGVLEGATGVGTGSALGTDTAGIAPSLGPKIGAELKNAVAQAVRQAAPGMGIEVSEVEGAVRVRFPANTVLFASGSAELTPQAARVLQRLVPVLARRQCLVKASGHTDDLPLRGGPYASNWELSSDRARNIALYLVRHRALTSDRCSFMGYADTQPLVPNTSEDNRARNRRVEITIRPLGQSGEAAGATTGEERAAGSKATSEQATPPPVTGDIAPPPINLKTEKPATEDL